MWKLIRTIGIFTGLTAISFSAAFFSQYKSNKKVDKKAALTADAQPVTISDKQRVLNSLLEIKAFEVDGSIDMRAKDGQSIGCNISGQGDLSNFDDIKVKGNMDVAINESHIKAHFGYFDNELFFNYNESYFKLETTKLMDFVQMLPNYGVNLSIPSEIEEIDLGTIEGYLDNMSEKELTNDQSHYFFTLNLSENMPIYVITDLDLNFTGIRTDVIDYKGMLFKMDVSLNRLDSVELVSPKNTPDYAKYQDFAPAFKLFDGLYSLTKKKQNTINADVNVRKSVEGELEPLLETNVDLIYDLASEKHSFGLEGKIIANKKTSTGTVEVETPYSFVLYDETIYAHYGDVAIKMKTDSLTSLLQFILNKIGDEKIDEMLNGLTGTMSTSQITDIVEKANNMLGTIVLTGDELDVNLNTSIFSTTQTNEETGLEEPKLTLSDLRIEIKFDGYSGELKTISIKNFSINSYVADVVLTFGEYRPFVFEGGVNYQSVDHLIGLANAYETYAAMDKFRLEFDATVSKDSEIVDGETVYYKDINIDGGLQFMLDPLREEEGHINVGFGYGNLNITDRNDTTHKIKVDMKSVDEILMSYSTDTGTSRDTNVSPMNVRMKVQTLKDIVELVSELVKNPDEHFNELFGSMLNQTGDMPIKQIIDGDYLQLLSTNLIDRFEVGDNYVEFDVALDILALEGASFTCRIEFTTREEGVDGLKALKISNLEFEGLHINFNAYLKNFDDNLESTRLDVADSYINFTDLKVLLQLGINTSKNNYYHFTANANVLMNLFNINFDLPLDIKVWTDHGDVKVSVDMTDIPVVIAVNVPTGRALTTSDRTAHLYYHDGHFLVNRTEYYTSGILWGKTTHKVEHIAKYDTNGFLDNVLDILCGDVLCLKDTWLDMINDSIEKNNNPNYKMKYENILRSFAYSKSGHYFEFDINLAEIANNDQLEKLFVRVHTDNTDTNLVGCDVDLKISLLGDLAIVLSLKLELADCSKVADSSNNLTELDAFEARMSGYADGYKTTTDSKI